ncbi:MAG: type II secretion system protein GspM [Pseudomonadota bacterium]
MIRWWETKEPRERALLLIAAALTLLVLGYTLLAQPFMNARGQAERALSSAQQDQSIVMRGISMLTSNQRSGSGAAVDIDDFRTMVTRSAREAGLSLARVQRGSDGTIQLRFDDTDPPRLFAWLATMETEPGGEIVAASISTRSDERVEAVVELRGGRET